MSKRIRLIMLAALVATSWGCRLSKADNPSPVGPSELALSLALLASPDTILRDGESQTDVVIQARDENGSPKSGVVVRLDIRIMSLLNNPMIRNEFGKLSVYEAMTGSNGQASVVYTAPKPFEEWQEDDLATNNVVIVATPVGTDAAAHLTRQVRIRLVDVTPNLASAALLPSVVLAAPFTTHRPQEVAIR